MEIEGIKRHGAAPSQRPSLSRSFTLRLAALEDCYKSLSQAQVDSCYILESLNHLIFGQIQSSILKWPAFANRAKHAGDQGSTQKDGKGHEQVNEETVRLQNQIQNTLDTFLSHNNMKLTQIGYVPPEQQGLHNRIAHGLNTNYSYPIRMSRSNRRQQQLTLSNVSALTCGQVSEVSSQGEASAPTFTPKIDATQFA